MKKYRPSKHRIAKFGAFTTKTLWKRYKGRCAYCGIELLVPNETQAKNHQYADRVFTIEHKIPISEGGTNNLRNLLPACKKCNNLRGSLHVDFFRYIIYRLSHPEIPKFTREHWRYLISKGINLGKTVDYKFYYETYRKNENILPHPKPKS